jgi:hypothetical protein
VRGRPGLFGITAASYFFFWRRFRSRTPGAAAVLVDETTPLQCWALFLRAMFVSPQAMVSRILIFYSISIKASA